MLAKLDYRKQLLPLNRGYTMRKLTIIISWLALCSFLFTQRPDGSYLRLDGDGDFLQLSDHADSLIFDGRQLLSSGCELILIIDPM